MADNKLLSFKKDDCVEYLDKHVDKMIEYYEKIFLATNWNKVTSRRIGLGEKVVDLANRIAITYHDLGKAFFQDRIAKGSGASYHEYFSVLILQKTFPYIKGYYNGLTDDVFHAISWSIIVHHLSLRRTVRNPLHVLIKPSTILGSMYRRSISEALVRAISEIIKSKLGLSVHVEPGIYTLDSLRKSFIAYNLDKWFKQYYPLALRITRVLIVTDTLAAQELRCTKDYRVYVADIPKPKTLNDSRRLVLKWLQDS